MCHNIIDRRLNGKNKNAVNRQRFIRRHKEQIRKAAADAISGRSITDVSSGEKVDILKRDVSEPIFNHNRDGKREMVHPGNKEFIAGDQIKRPLNSGNGTDSGNGQASEDGEGEDTFAFELSVEEFLEFFFEDLELPNLNKARLGMTMEYQTVRAGYTNNGVPANIDVIKSLQGALSRRIALQGPYRKALRKAKETLEVLQVPIEDEANTNADSNTKPDLITIAETETKIKSLQRHIKAIPYIDDFDLRYRNHARQPRPKTQAVMFCLMDVSASMDQQRKRIAKRFFILLYFFLNRTYKHTKVVFIRHHVTAREVDEEEFFKARETGGTVVSSALKLMNEIIDERFPISEWNIYGAQASDGDNWGRDPNICGELLINKLLPKCQYYAYVQIVAQVEQGLWKVYETISQSEDNFAIKKITELADIYPVFRQLMKKRES